MIPAKEIDGELWVKASDHHQAIKEALAQQELVAYWKEHAQGLQRDYDSLLADFQAQRTWVGLTEEDLKLLSAEWRIVYGAWMDDFARDIEAKLTEKNT